MSIKPISFDTSDPHQRKAYAINFLNLDIDDGDDDGDIVAKIRAAQPGVTTIFIEEQDQALQGSDQFDSPVPLGEDGAAVQQARSGTLGQRDPKAVIHISAVESDDGRGNDDVYVGVNGRGWQLKRGEDLTVPWRVVEALGLTIPTNIRHEQQNDGSGNVKIIEQQTRRFPVQIVSRPSLEDIEAWHAETDNKFCP